MRFTWILLGVPKFRTCKRKFYLDVPYSVGIQVISLFIPAKKTNRRFGWTKLYQYNENIVQCPTCLNPHLVLTVCGHCYEAIKRQTDQIKVEKMGLRKVV